MQDQQLPSDFDAEQSVIGSILVDPKILPQIIDVIRAEDFYQSLHGLAFTVMVDMFRKDDEIGPITFIAELQRRDILKRFPGEKLWVHDVISDVAVARNGIRHAELIAETATRRRIIEASAATIDAAFNNPGDLTDLANKAHSTIVDAIQGVQRNKPISAEELVTTALQELENAERRQGKFAGLPTGFDEIDRRLSGMLAGSMIVVAARPGVGKSAFAVNVARNVAMEGGRVVMFSLEMGEWEIGMRLLAAEASIDITRIRAGRLTGREWESFIEASEKLAKIPFEVIDGAGMTPLEIRAVMQRLEAEKHVDLVIVDYLQLMHSNVKTNSREQEVAEISRSMKLMAKQLRCPVIAVCQLNRDVENRRDKTPLLSDLRESGSLEQDADVVFLLSANEDNPDLIEFHIAKHRNGPTGVAKLYFMAHTTQFYEVDTRFEKHTIPNEAY